MHIFVTGASGFIGLALTRHFTAAGHTVSGLARSGRAATAVTAAGGTVVEATLDDTEALAIAASAADGVIHCAYDHNAPDKTEAAARDARAIEAMGTALAGSDRPLVVTTGMSGIAPGRIATEEDSIGPDYERFTPRLSEQTALALAVHGIRAMAIRFPPTVHGPGDAAYIPALIGFARNSGRAAYVGDGANRWPAIHIADAVRLYARAFENGTAGAVYHGVGDEGVAFGDIAAVIGDKLGLPVTSIAPAEADLAFGWLAPLAQADVPASSRLTQQHLDWQPREIGLIADMQTGGYFPD